MKKILITGAEGFIGTYLVNDLKKRDVDYLGIGMKYSDNMSTYKQLIADITNTEVVMNILEKYNPDSIIHLAAIASVTHKNNAELYRVNVFGTENILESAKKICKKGTRVILMSSAGVYGRQEIDYISERESYNPINHYSYTKMITEVMSRQYEDDLDIKIVRPFTVIGQGQGDGFFVAKLVKKFKERSPEIKVGNIEAIRDYTDVELCANLLAELACRDNVEDKVLNVCTGIEMKGTDVINLLRDITGFCPRINISQEYIRNNEIWRLVGNKCKLEAFMGNKYRYRSVREIITEMLQSGI